MEVTDLREIHWFSIGIKRNREGGTIMLSQRAYIDLALRRYGFEDVRQVSIPSSLDTIDY